MLTSPHSGTATGPCHRPGVLRQGAVILLVATALSLFFGAQNYFSAASIHREVSWGQALYWSFTDWYEWALLAPIIFWTCRNFRFERRSWPKGLIIYLSVGLLLSGVHAVLCAGADVLQGWVTAQPIAFRKSLRGVLANRTHYNLAVFAVMVCAWHAWSYYREFREREMQATELAGRLAQAQLQALRMQLNPHFLFNALNAVSSPWKMPSGTPSNRKRPAVKLCFVPFGTMAGWYCKCRTAGRGYRQQVRRRRKHLAKRANGLA